MGILSQEVVASGKSLRSSGGKANPRVTAAPITGSNTIWPTSPLCAAPSLEKVAPSLEDREGAATVARSKSDPSRCRRKRGRCSTSCVRERRVAFGFLHAYGDKAKLETELRAVIK
jgi:hypothetical protein